MKNSFRFTYNFIKRLVLTLTFCIVICRVMDGQTLSKKDSIFLKLKTEKYDTVKIILYNNLKNIYNKEGKPDSGFFFINKAVDLSRKIKNSYYLAFSLNQKGYCFEKIGERDSALTIFIHNSKLPYDSRNYGEVLSALSHIGDYYYDKGDFNLCLVSYQKHLTLSNKFQDSARLITAHNNIGNIYLELKRPNLALDYFKKSLNFVNVHTNDFHYCQLYFSISSAFADLAKNKNTSYFADSAICYINKSLKLANKLGEHFMIANDYAILGNVFFDKENYDSSIFYYNKSIQLRKDQELDIFIPEVVNLSCSYSNIGNHKKATEIGEDLIKNYRDMLAYTDFAEVYGVLSMSANHMKNYSDAYKYMRLAKLYTDSVFSESASEKRKELEMNFDFQKKQETQKAEQEKKDIVAAQEIKQQRQQRNYLIIGLIIVAVFSIFIFNGLKKQRKANHIIAEQKIIVEEKHKEITDSINYAERIQRSFLASKELLDQNLRDYFVFFQPKDVVSGDFYWAASSLSHPNSNSNLFYLVTADSTGHGVPGAIMSLLNITSIESAFKDGNTSPADILNTTRKTIIERLKKDGTAEGGKDGMDCSLICFDFANNVFTYAAANNPVWVVRENQLIELAPDKMPVGKHDKDQMSFTQNEFQLQKGDVVYTLTDGLPDQFGGPSGKKFKYRQLKELLVSIAVLPMEIQKEKLNASFVNWKGDLEQLDDVCVIGIKL